MDSDNIQSQMKKGLLEFCILSIIKRGESYPSDIVAETKRVRHASIGRYHISIVDWTQKCGILRIQMGRKYHRPPRKYFTMSESGKEFYNSFWKPLGQKYQPPQNILPRQSEINNNNYQKYKLKTTLSSFKRNRYPNIKTTTWKKSFKQNIKAENFSIEESAYQIFQQYELDLKQFFSKEEGDEIFADLQYRMSEILEQRCGQQTIYKKDIEALLIEMIGKPIDFETNDTGNEKKWTLQP